jgi:hypothetical protein
MTRNHVFFCALLLAGCAASRLAPSPGVPGTVWVSPITPQLVDTLAFDQDGTFRWYGAELDSTDVGTWQRSADTLFLETPGSPDIPEEVRWRDVSRYKLVVRTDTLEVVFAQHGIAATPKMRFDPPYVFTPLMPAGPAASP